MRAIVPESAGECNREQFSFYIFLCQDVTHLFISSVYVGVPIKTQAERQEGGGVGQFARPKIARHEENGRARARVSSRDKVASWGRIKRDQHTLSISDTLWQSIGWKRGTACTATPRRRL